MTADPVARPAARATRCWTLHSPDGAVDVEVTAADGDALGAVLPALAAGVGPAEAVLWAGSRPLPPDTPLTAAELVHGAVLGLGRPGPRQASGDCGTALELRLVGGPDAGRTVPLTRGHHVLGRGTGAAVHLEDPDVSRAHAVVQVGSGELTVCDLGSTNGTRLDGEPIDARPRPWPAGGRLQLGATTVTVTGPAIGPATVEPGVGGRLLVRSGPRVTAPPAELEVTFPRRPEPQPVRRLPWVGLALPAVGGVAMAWLLHTPTFLFFAVLGPLIAVGSWVSDRWSSRRALRRDTATYEAELDAAECRLAEAVAAARAAAEAAHPDLAALASAARRRTQPLWSRGRAAGDALTVRLGLGPGLSRVTRTHPDGARERVPAAGLPVSLDLRATGGLGIVGPRRWTASVLRALVGQLAVLHPPGEIELALLADARTVADWAWARWLPHLRAGSPVATDERVDAWLAGVVAGRRAGAGVPAWLVLVVDRTLDPRLAERVAAARDAGIVVITAAESSSALPIATGALLHSRGEVGDTARLVRDGCPDEAFFVADRAAVDTAGSLARDLACLLPATPEARLPSRVRLLELPLPGMRLEAGDRCAGAWARDRRRLLATLGTGETGPVTIDLCREGPHALVAGTTGSGKSELLQTLIASLALAHPPDRCSFLLVDYKGGAAFAAATTLPHTVGVLTDLDGQATARALRSLTAELTRRETVLAAHGVTDLSGLPESVPLARLVIIVDEFATLAEELPEFVPGLVGIAQRGRSLGVHLVLATQRPGGVVSPEIRANCTLRLCLRTTDEADSRDVLGTAVAAHLPVDLPGRCFLRTGSGAPVPFQAARVTTSPGAVKEPHVRRAAWPPEDRAPVPDTCTGEETDLARVAGATRRAAAGSLLPHRPWQEPLPDRLEAAALGSPGRRRIRLGLVDRPDLQAREPLDLDLDRGGAWLAVGGPRSGRTTLLRTVLAGAVTGAPPEELHVHVLDHGGGALAAEATRWPHAGTCIGATDAFRTLRVLDRLGQEVARRRAGAPSAAGTPGQPRLLLLVDGVESLLAQLDECDPQGGSAVLLRLARDGAAVGLSCVLTADRAVPGSRIAAAAQHRLVLPLPDPADYAVAGIRPGAVPRHRPAGRALLADDEAECQLALPLALAPTREAARGAARPRAYGALRIVELPADPARPRAGTEVAAGDGGPADGALTVVLGPGGDEGQPIVCDLARTGGLLVVGPPGSGRSSTLAVLADQARDGAARVLVLARGGGTGADLLDPRDSEGIAAWLAADGPRPAVIVADDVGAAADWPGLSAGPDGIGRGPVLLVAGSATDLAGHYQGQVAALRRSRQGLLLCPGPAEADLLGIRLPRTPLPIRPGSGWLAGPAGLTRVQVARRREP